jgi:hypothetical protein
MTETLIPCPCPQLAGKVQHPDGDTVTLREHLDFRSALGIRNDFILLRNEDGVSIGEALAALSEGYLYHGIEAWTLKDEKGKPLPVSHAAIRDALLSRPEIAVEVADAADELYGKSVILPLLARAATSSQPTPTKLSTSATKPVSKRPTPSSRSSTTTSRTGATGKITALHAGASN